MHLHDEKEAERARTAISTWEKANLDEVTTVALSNMEALTDTERDTHRRLNRLGYQIELGSIIGTTPSAVSADVPLGWTKLLIETDTALKPFDFSIDHPKPTAEAKIKYSEANLQDLTDEIRAFDSLANDFQDVHGDVLSIEWMKMLAPGPELERVLKEAGVTGHDREDYIALAKEAVELRELNMWSTLPDSDLDLRSNIVTLEERVKRGKNEIKSLSKHYREAMKALQAAEKALAEAAGQPPDALEALKKKVEGQLVKVTDLVKKGQDLPIGGELLRMDALVGILKRYDDLGDDDSTGAVVAKSLLNALATDSSVAERLGLPKTSPSINALILELAVQQMAYEQAVARQTYEERELQLLNAMEQTHERSLRAWITVAHQVREKRRRENEAVVSKVLEQADIDYIRNRPLDEYFKKATPEMKESVIEALVAYGIAVAHGEQRLRELDVERRSALRRLAVERSRVALTAWKAIVRAPLQELALYHEGGVKSQEIVEFLKAIGIGAVAVGVN